MRLLRYAIARQIIHFGLRVMPEGRYKAELLDVLYALSAKVHHVVAARKEQG